MRPLKTFSIDHSLILKLKKEPNQSALINHLLRQYFFDNMSLTHLKQEKIKREKALMRAQKDFDEVEKKIKECESNPLQEVEVYEE